MKSIFGVIFFLGSFYGALAQWSLGVKAGVNNSTEPVGNGDYVTSYQTNINGGIQANYSQKGGRRALVGQVEILYSGEGTNEKYRSDGSAGSIKRIFIRVPVLLQYHHFSGFYVETGPQIGILISSHEQFNGVVNDILSYYHRLNISWCLGAGYRLDKLLKGLGAGARWAEGLTRLNKLSIAGNSLRSRVFSLDLFYTLSLKNR